MSARPTGPIGRLLNALREIAEAVGMEAATDVSQFPKFFFRSTFGSGSGRLQVKVEINTYETSPARPHIRLPHHVESPWWSGSAEGLTFEPAELIATKLRALYQRRKGRDLFDLWLALTKMGLDSDEILTCLGPYRPDGDTTATAVANLQEHVGDLGFRTDLLDLVGEETGFDVDGRLSWVGPSDGDGWKSAHSAGWRSHSDLAAGSPIPPGAGRR